jgi:hypothetical protein
VRVFKAFNHAFIVSKPWQPHSLDARGVERPIYDLRGYWFRRFEHGALPTDVFTRIRKRLLRGGWNKGLGPPEAVSATLLVVFGGYALHLLTGGLGPAVRIPAIFLILVALVQGLVALTRRFRMPRADEREIQRAFLAEHRCPTCAFPLESLAPDSQGVVTCPECGSSWGVATSNP